MVAGEFVEISRLGMRRTRADNIRDIASGQLKLTSVRYDSLTGRAAAHLASVGPSDPGGVQRQPRSASPSHPKGASP